MSTADHETCCCAETLDDLRAIKAAYKAALHGRNELAARGFRTAAPDITLTRTNNGAPETPEAVPREGQEGAGNAPSRAADGLAGSDRHSGTPATGEARKSAESDADDDAEWAARDAIERDRGER